MIIYAKLLYNGAEVAVLENFTLKFENFNFSFLFFLVLAKNIPGGAEVPWGFPITKNFPRGWHPLHPPPSPPPDRSTPATLSHQAKILIQTPQTRGKTECEDFIKIRDCCDLLKFETITNLTNSRQLRIREIRDC